MVGAVELESTPSLEVSSVFSWGRQAMLWLVIPWDACWMKMFSASGIVKVAAFPGGLPDGNKMSGLRFNAVHPLGRRLSVLLLRHGV